MREIKFRFLIEAGAFTKYTKWVYYSLDQLIELATCDGGDAEAMNLSRAVAKNEYTGLKDKNGKEIYEGDIISWTGYKIGDVSPVSGKPYTRYNSVVVFVESAWHLRGEKNSMFQLGIYTDKEVIGNIYENKELLEESD